MFEISDLMVNIGEVSTVDLNDIFIEKRKLFASDHIEEYLHAYIGTLEKVLYKSDLSVFACSGSD